MSVSTPSYEVAILSRTIRPDHADLSEDAARWADFEKVGISVISRIGDPSVRKKPEYH
jgi:hypothetical protein